MNPWKAPPSVFSVFCCQSAGASKKTPGGLTASWAGLRGPLAIAKGGGMLKGDEHQNGIVASVR
jgi:hypothetical protein